MKSTDIIVGTEYAWARGDWEFEGGRADRVRVTGKGALVRQGRYGSGKVKGIEVDYLNSDGTFRYSGVVLSRQIRETWDSYAARWRETRAAQRRSANIQQRLRDERAQRLLDLVPALRHAGIEDTTHRVYDDGVRGLLEKHVPDLFVLNEDGGTTSEIEAPLASSIEDYVKRGDRFELTADELLQVTR